MLMPIRPLAAFTIAFLTAVTGASAADAPVYVAPVVAVPAPDNACADGRTLDRIMERFAWAERNTWRRGFVMETLSNPRPSGHPYAEPGIVERTYCMADSMMTDGQLRTVYYTIEYGMGFASIGDYVDFCVLGLDPWRVHDGACRTVR
jgi:hypothetical protein